MDFCKKAAVASCTFGLLGSSFGASAQDLPTLMPKTDPEPYGELAEAAQVSAARIVVGVALVGEVPGNKPDLIALVPADWASHPICARLISPDALFEGLAEYNAPDEPDNDLVRLGDSTPAGPWFTAEHWTELKKRNVAELALAVTKGACSAPSSEFALSALSANAAELATTVAVYVNSQGAERVFAEVATQTGEKAVTLCDRSGSQSTVGYDRLCLADIDGISGKLEVRINRVNYGAYEDPVDLTIYAGPLD